MNWFTKGMRGDYVKDIQGVLWQAGMYEGRIDGLFGPKTDESVRQWQREMKVLPDGIWGSKTTQASAEFLGKFNDAESLAKGYPPVIPNLGKGMA